MPHPILVRKIKHLTDARYFAAMGVDWMSMELNEDPASFMTWHTLRDWVEGVRLVAEINAEDDMLLAKTIIDAKPAGIFLSNMTGVEIPDNVIKFYQMDSPVDVHLYPRALLVLSYIQGITEMDLIRLIPPEKIFLQAEWTREALAEALSNGYEGGICFIGGDEDKTGMRDYGEIDKMLEVVGRF